jgi:hypothetical protein
MTLWLAHSSYFATADSLGFMLSPYAYAWLFVSITANLIVLSSLQNPLLAVHFAFHRTFEVIIGSTVALLVTFALAPDAPSTAPAARGWSEIWDRNWPHLLHANARGPDGDVAALGLELDESAEPGTDVGYRGRLDGGALTSDLLETGRQVARHSLQDSSVAIWAALQGSGCWRCP